jgi:5-methylthioadenosine/S-adenosylhomocysteine deaminase
MTSAERADRPPAADLVIAGCTVLVHDEGGGRIDFVDDAAVVVRDGVIGAVTTAAVVVDLPAAERIDGRGQLAMPG